MVVDREIQKSIKSWLIEAENIKPDRSTHFVDYKKIFNAFICVVFLFWRDSTLFEVERESNL
jgi:hypothetical protein